MNTTALCRSALVVALACLAPPASAQDEATPTFITSVFQCDLSGLDALVAQDMERALPIMQAAVDDGTILSAGEARHQWGDEFNLLTWISGPDMASALTGWEALTSRYRERYPDDTLAGETCPTHRDYFFTRRAWVSRDAPPIDPENPPTLALSYYTCDYSALGGIIEDYREKTMPIAQALVDEGMMGSEGLYTHEWGDEWNLVITRTAADLGALDGALRTLSQRYEAAHGTDAANLIQENCSAHKDNLYWMMMSAD